MSKLRRWNQGRAMMINNRNPKAKHKDSCDRYYARACSYDKKTSQCSYHRRPKRWSALAPTDGHVSNSNVAQNANVTQGNDQHSLESIVIKDSCDIQVSSTDIQAAFNLQVALQVAIAVVISISITDSNQADNITQDLFANLKSSQMNRQQVYIENSWGLNVTTKDTDVSVNIQVLLQILIVLVARIDVL